MNTPRIAIVGAGPGGLICARMLQQLGVPASVYDADATATSRDAGGTLDLHADTGQIALEDAGLLGAFEAVARTEDQSKTRRDHHGSIVDVYVPETDDTAAPEIDRGQLRELLAAGLRPDTVQWGRKLTRAEPLGGGGHRLEFDDGRVDEVELLIGADGVWSRVRPLLTPAAPEYSGISFLDVRYDDVSTRHPDIDALVDTGHLWITDSDGRAVIAQRNSGGQVRAYLALRTALDWHERAGVHLDDPGAVGAFLHREFAGWWSAAAPLLTDVDGGYRNRPIWTLPAPLRWEHRRGVTLLGDAAHAMAPFGGYGVNLALLDGVELARAIAGAADPDDAVAAYEAEMMNRAGPIAVAANEAMQRFFTATPDAPAAAPDNAAQHRRYREGAAAYRADRAVRSPVERWVLQYRTPRGEQTADLALSPAGSQVTGTFDGRAVTSALREHGSIRFVAQLTTPFPMKVSFTLAESDDGLVGHAKAPMMTIPVTGARCGADGVGSATR